MRIESLVLIPVFVPRMKETHGGRKAKATFSPTIPSRIF